MPAFSSTSNTDVRSDGVNAAGSVRSRAMEYFVRGTFHARRAPRIDGFAYVAVAAAAAVLAAFMAAAPAEAARVAEMEIMQRAAHHAKEGTSLSQIGAAIAAAAQRSAWTVQSESPGVTIAERVTQEGKHRVAIKISYDATTYLIEYQDSANLGYTENHCVDHDFGNPNTKRNHRVCVGAGIHPYYNAWIGTLAERIETFIAEIS